MQLPGKTWQQDTLWEQGKPVEVAWSSEQCFAEKHWSRCYFKHNPLLKPGNGIPWLKGPIFNRKIHPATLQKWFKNGLRDKTKISAWFWTPHFPYLNLIKNLIKKEYIAAKILLWQDIIRGVVEAIRERVFCSHKRELNNIREWVWCSCLSL